MSTRVRQALQGAAGAAGGGGLNVEDVFSTYLYKGNGTGQTITNGIDLSTEGGLVWMKNRSPAGDHNVYDTVRGRSVALRTNQISGEYSVPSGYGLTSFNTDGFTLGTGYNAENTNNDDLASWTFRKAPKFFDVVTWSGNGTSGRTISHNLGSTPGMIIVKRTNGSYEWIVQHRSLSAGYVLYLNLSDAQDNNPGAFTTTLPTSTVFTVGNNNKTNQTGGEYVAYLFAHNDGDGNFGPTGDQDIIKCGSFTVNSSGWSVDLGFEPQWVMIKKSSGTSDWGIVDNMRSWDTLSGTGDNASQLRANLSNAENRETYPRITATGFNHEGAAGWLTSGQTYIYIAIRRGPMAVPESATDVFAPYVTSSISNNGSTATLAGYNVGFPADLTIQKNKDGTDGWYAGTRLTGNKYLKTETTAAEGSSSGAWWDSNVAVWQWASGYGTYNWRRAPNYFDVVAFTAGTSANRRLDHNLGVAPEMVWVKRRDGARNWYVYHEGMDASPRNYKVHLNLNSAKSQTNDIWGTSDPTATDFGLNENDVVGVNGSNCIAYLFASLDGVSKVGSYTGTGGTVDVDLGFNPRFFMTKGASQTGSWHVFDTERGIVAGSDPALFLESTSAQLTGYDLVDPITNGIRIIDSSLRDTGQTYIYYAIA